VLNRPNYEVASASVRGFGSRISLQEGDFSIAGRLYDFSLRDLTDRGALYRDRLVPRPCSNASDDGALYFHVFRHGQDDPNLKRFLRNLAVMDNRDILGLFFQRI